MIEFTQLIQPCTLNLKTQKMNMMNTIPILQIKTGASNIVNFESKEGSNTKH